MILLLPPSEGKRPGGDGVWDPASGRFGTALQPSRDLVSGMLSRTGRGVGGSLWRSAGCLPAHERYHGVVWRFLDPPTLDEQARQRAEQSVLVVSALGGLFAWDDPVPDYKLKFNARDIGMPRPVPLWRPLLGPLLDGHDVIDLTALEQFAALERPIAGSWTRLELIGPAGQRAGHHGKAAKGRLARRLLEVGDLSALAGHHDPEGWTVRVER